ncbi:beta-ketoacyl synthase N-terminal-like domain-containing protein, partial [Actinoplanes sp. NEAU-A12]
MRDELSPDLPVGAAVSAWVARRCGLAPEEIDRDCPLVEFGISSVEAVELAGLLESRLGRPLPATLLWEHPTVNAIERAMTGEPAPADQRVPPTTPEPVAVIGMGCRFPGGADDPDRLWRLLMDGRDAVRTVPPERWQRRLATGPVQGAGGFLGDVARFDTAFFGIAPGEARLMDPQQRLLLEVAWDALAHAALDPAALRGSRTGVYVGICASEYAHLTTAELDRVEGWTATGAALSIAANRLSYLLDARGPSMAVDTACSSSLVAIHLAARDLRSGETDLALAAGVSLMLDPALTVAFGRAGGLAAGGRCRPFSADADGIVRGEGCGVVVLKRLSDAVRDSDRVLAVLRGGAVNSDGRSNGLVAPNPKAQEALLRQAYADAGWPPSTVDYVEAHGTGTPLGDPIEAGALGAVCGAGRPAGDPLLIGSVKSRIGHLEAAAGVAGFITAVLALRHGMVPRTLHAERVNPRIPLDAWGLRVPVAAQPLPARDRPARAGVSAFGFGGTNAHAVLEAYPDHSVAFPDSPATERDEAAVCVISDRDLDRVRDQAGALAAWLADRGDQADRADRADGEEPGAGDRDAGLARDVAGTLARRGDRGPVRAAVLARDPATLVAGLSAVAAGRAHPLSATGSGSRAAEGGVWVFSGYGAHWPGMGRALLEREPAFAAAVDDLTPAFRAELGLSLRDALSGDARLSVAQAQPVTFGLQVALAALWRRHGLRPAAVIGHSMGEVAAAVVADALSPEDGVRLIVRRARLLATVGPGAMAVMELSEEELADLAGDLPQVSVAVLAAPRQLVVTGPPEAVDVLAARAAARGHAVRTVTTEGAGHSPAVDPLLPELREALRGLRPREPRLPFFSTVLPQPPVLPGTPVPPSTPDLDAEYWLANLRQPVRLADAVRGAAHAGFGFFLEISPHPVLVRPIGQTLAAAGVPDPLVTGTLRRDDPDAFGRALATVCAHGHRPPAGPSRILDLPAPPWRGDRHWIDPVPDRAGPPDAARPALLDGLLGLAWRRQPAPASDDPASDDPTADHRAARAVTLLGRDDDPLVRAVLTDPAAPPDTRRADLDEPDVRPPAADRDEPGMQPAGADEAGAGDQPAGADGYLAGRDLVLIAPPAGALPDPVAALRLAGSAVHAAAAGARRLLLVTRGGATPGSAEPGQPDLAWLRGLVRTLAFEQPLTRATWLDLDPAENPGAQAARLWSELAAGDGDGDGDDEVAWRDGQRWAARLVRLPVPGR